MSVVIPLVVDSEGCGFGATSDASWLDVRREADALVLDVDANVSTGIHRSLIVVHGSSDQVPLAMFEVTLRAMHQAPEGSPRYALVLGVDGLRPDAIAPSETPNIDWLFDHGAGTLTASTQLETDTVSGPGWASILTGVDADKHLVDGNDDLGDIDRAFPTLLKRALDAGLEVGMGVNWVGVLALAESEVTRGVRLGDDATVAARTATMLREQDRRLVFVHFDDPDHTGHDTGYGPDNPAYVETLAGVDRNIGTLLDAVLERPTVAGEDWLIVLTTDHGGEGTGHGPRTPIHRTIPLLFASPAMAPGVLEGAFVSHLDVHPTTLAFLGIEPLATWELDGVVAVRARPSRAD